MLSRRSYALVSSIGKPVDLALIATPTAAVPAVLQDAARVGVKAAVILSAAPREAAEAKRWNACHHPFTSPKDEHLQFLETDPVHGNTTQQFRMRPGRTTPTFRILGNTHFFVLEGQVTMTPVAGRGPITLKPNDYAYLPDGYAFSLTNARQSAIGGN